MCVYTHTHTFRHFVSFVRGGFLWTTSRTVLDACMCASQLLVAVFVDAVRLQGGLSMYTDLQRSWLMYKDKIMSLKPLAPVKAPSSRFRRRVWAFARTDAFNHGTLAVIVMNTLMMATESYNADHEYVRQTERINWAFTVIFVSELIIRLIADGHRFFYNGWNLFDLFVVITSIIEQLLSASIGIKVLRALRISRVFRTIRIVRRFPRLYTIIKALGSAMPALMSAVLLVLIVSFIFTALGVQFFAGVKHGRLLDRDRNFDNSWTCMTLLFQVATGSGYTEALADASVVWPACTKCTMCKQQSNGDWVDYNDCGNWQGAGAFLGVYLLTVRYVLLNLLVSVLVDKFFTFEAHMRFVLQDHHLETFQTAWQALDVHGDGTLPISQLRVLVDLLHRFKNPLGSAMFADEFKYRLTRVELIYNCPHYGMVEGSELEFNQTMLTLALHVTGPHALPLDLRLQREESLTMFAQWAVTSKVALVYNQKRLAATLEHEKQSSLVKMVRSSMANGEQVSQSDHFGQNLFFSVFNGRSQVVLDMHREELLHIDDGSPPTIMFQMPFKSIAGVTDTYGAALVINFEDEIDLSVEIDDEGRVQLVDVLRSFQDINQLRIQKTEEDQFFNRKDMQSEFLRFRLVASTAMLEVDRAVELLKMKRKRD